jgi:hypothetical protein
VSVRRVGSDNDSVFLRTTNHKRTMTQSVQFAR